ncbi:MAG: hypothetical protein R3185_05500, partial [Candidatus Thermoplasmatota archaeon]|nr:hypothetical protein [Candidatus Thermoplasmatota archaeon]
MTVEARCREAADKLSSLDFVRIHSDDDADGIAAASVMAAALDRQGIPFHLTMGRLDATDYPALEAHDNLLLMDQGSGELDQLARHPGEVIVLDHHVVEGRAPRIVHANPNLEGENGTDTCCAATLSLYTALHLDPVNTELAPIAMAGVVGDRQHVPKLRGSNASLAQRAISTGGLEAQRALPFPPGTSLNHAIASSVDPFLKGLTGRARAAHAFLEELGIEPSQPVDSLTAKEARLLTSALVAHLLSHGIEPRLAEELAGMRYYGEVAGRLVSAHQLSALFNACAREERPGLALAAAQGDLEAFKEASSL